MNRANKYTTFNPLSIDRYQLSEGNNATNERFEINTLESMEAEGELSDEPEKLDRFEIFWTKKGKGTLWVDEQNFEISDNYIYCLAPGCVRKCNFKIISEGYYISFASEFVWLSEGYSNNSFWPQRYSDDFKATAIIVGEEMNHELEVIVRKMKWEFNNYFNQRLQLLKGLLNIFLIYFSRNLKTLDRDVIQTKESELVKKFILLLKMHFTSKKMVCQYAAQLFVTPNYLNKTVKKITGFTASHHIQQLIILEAKRRAIYSSSSMKEIAYFLGFDNLAHFSKFFKNNCGMSFTSFKNSALKID